MLNALYAKTNKDELIKNMITVDLFVKLDDEIDSLVERKLPKLDVITILFIKFEYITTEMNVNKKIQNKYHQTIEFLRTKEIHLEFNKKDLKLPESVP